MRTLLELEIIPVEATEYMTFIEEVTLTNAEAAEENQEASSLVSLKNNKVAHSDGFHIELSTIHGVKGETHDVTLIVETKNYTFDLEKMLPYLTGELPNADNPNSSIRDKPNSRRHNKIFMRQFYVAMSRPKHLLCLAMHSDRISDDQKKLLQDNGWRVEILESRAEGVA